MEFNFTRYAHGLNYTQTLSTAHTPTKNIYPIQPATPISLLHITCAHLTHDNSPYPLTIISPKDEF
jgi:hypothetical protein